MRLSKTLPAVVLSSLCVVSAQPARAIDLTALSGLVVTSSSDYGGAGPTNGPKANILDNNFDTYWNAGALSGWVQVDFGSAYVFDRVELYGNNTSYVDNYQLLASVDGTAWSSIASGSYHTESSLTGSRKFGAVHDYTTSTEPVGRYLRYSASTPAVWAYLGELEVTGHVATVPEPGAWGLMLSGLGLVGFAARRRTAATI